MEGVAAPSPPLEASFASMLIIAETTSIKTSRPQIQGTFDVLPYPHILYDVFTLVERIHLFNYFT